MGKYSWCLIFKKIFIYCEIEAFFLSFYKLGLTLFIEDGKINYLIFINFFGIEWYLKKYII